MARCCVLRVGKGVGCAVGCNIGHRDCTPMVADQEGVDRNRWELKVEMQFVRAGRKK